MPGFELIGEEEKQALIEVFDDGGIFFRHGFDDQRNGRYRVIEFEKLFAEYIQADFALAVTSGTAAIKIALKALGVKPGDEVITQPFTFIATIEAILDIGAIPIFADIDETLNLDPNKIEKKITDKTRVLLPVDMLGVPADYDSIIKIAKKYDLKVLGDSCEAMGADYNGSKLGNQADITCWSLDFGKTITTGEGGMINTNNPDLYKYCKEYHDHGHENNPNLERGKDSRSIYGFNYRMTELQAAIGMAQLKKLDYIVDKNRENYKKLLNLIEKHPNLKFREIPDKSNPLNDTLIFSLPTKKDAEQLTGLLKKNGISTKNIPSAMEWHFAGYWDHMCSALNMDKNDLHQTTKYSGDILKRSIAIGIMVKDDKSKLEQMAEIVNQNLLRLL
tara:strand:+ start:570 stop:1739 length:1170 start_codon:yes stop_codon:yes gene_type:complete